MELGMASSPGVINSPESSCEVTNTLAVAEHFSIIPDASTLLRVIEDNRFAQKKELRTVKRKYRNLLKRFHDSEEVFVLRLSANKHYSLERMSNSISLL